jgi:predicted DNA-binding transcriptional regulator AlpA
VKTHQNPKIYFIKDVEVIANMNRQTLRRKWKRKEFPEPTLLGARLAWSAETIHQWIEQNVRGIQNDK